MTSSSITVIGADDPLGEAVVREALVRGLLVQATAVHPEQLPRLSPTLRVVRARPAVQHELVPAISGTDAVVLGLSPHHRVGAADRDRKSTRLNSSHVARSYARCC